MNKFFAQIEAINPALVIPFERLLFQAADRMVEGYNGGSWDEVALGQNVYGLRCPCGDNARVRLVNGDNYCDVTTDARTAGCALAQLALNQLLWMLHHNNRHKEAQAMTDLFYKVQNRARMKPNQLDVPSMVAFLD